MFQLGEELVKDVFVKSVSVSTTVKENESFMRLSYLAFIVRTFNLKTVLHHHQADLGFDAGSVPCWTTEGKDGVPFPMFGKISHFGL